MAYMLAKEGGLWTHLSPNQRLALLLAALCHDYEHPGVSAAYLHKAKSRLASWFRGDPGLLEKHHSIRSFELLTCKHVGLLCHLPTTDRIEVPRPSRAHPCRFLPVTDARRVRGRCAGWCGTRSCPRT